jgi:alpha-beta hydrolase superfamily lysophospholipase
VVIVGIHGLGGAAVDYNNLGKHLLKHQSRTAVYAYEVRGQGSDPHVARRGDINDPREWYQDLDAFTQSVRQRHPRAKVVWFGESMGGLIAANALREARPGTGGCDGLILSSPVVRVHPDIPCWKQALVRVAGTALPAVRVRLDSIAGGHPIEMTATSVHSDQSAKNEYHLERTTLRLLAVLARQIEQMPRCAASFQVPVLVLRGEKDALSEEKDVLDFLSRVPEGVPRTFHQYAGAYHLLMYDMRREEVFHDVSRWIEWFRKSRRSPDQKFP